jgi:hypothetical protein
MSRRLRNARREWLYLSIAFITFICFILFRNVAVTVNYCHEDPKLLMQVERGLHKYHFK